jgi:hypothetical protein
VDAVGLHHARYRLRRRQHGPRPRQHGATVELRHEHANGLARTARPGLCRHARQSLPPGLRSASAGCGPRPHGECRPDVAGLGRPAVRLARAPVRRAAEHHAPGDGDAHRSRAGDRSRALAGYPAARSTKPRAGPT